MSSTTNEREIYIDKDNDKYFGDLPLFNKRRQAWSASHPQYRMYRILTFAVLFVGLAIMVYLALRIGDEGSMNPLYVAILGTAAAAFLVAYAGKRIYEQPFNKFQSARFEATDTGLYYIYQKGMTLNTYLIKDKDIRRIVRDDQAAVILIEGPAELQVQSRKGTEHSRVDHLYALVPCDEFDLDDLLEPYGDLVSVEPGTLRERSLHGN